MKLHNLSLFTPIAAWALLVPALARGESTHSQRTGDAAHTVAAKAHSALTTHSSNKPHSPRLLAAPNSSPNTSLHAPNASASASALDSQLASHSRQTPKHLSARAGHQKASPQYVESVRGWHQSTAQTGGAPLDENGRPMLVLNSLNTRDRATLRAATDEGGFSAQDLDRAAVVLRDSASGNQHPVEPRTLDLLYRIQRQFNAPEIRVVSGYRTPYRGNSNHGKGRAVDFLVPGTSDDRVAAFARQLGFVGVGIYPESGFVHVDVRERSYFWVDASAPGHRHQERAILSDVAYRADAKARARGEEGVRPQIIGRDVDAMIATQRPAAGVNHNHDHSHDEIEGRSAGGNH